MGLFAGIPCRKSLVWTTYTISYSTTPLFVLSL